MADDACMTSSNLLDSHVHVREYDIHLKPNFDTFRFEGVSKIALDITDSTKVINLHAKELAISAGVGTAHDVAVVWYDAAGYTRMPLQWEDVQF